MKRKMAVVLVMMSIGSIALAACGRKDKDNTPAQNVQEEVSVQATESLSETAEKEDSKADITIGDIADMSEEELEEEIQEELEDLENQLTADEEPEQAQGDAESKEAKEEVFEPAEELVNAPLGYPVVQMCDLVVTIPVTVDELLAKLEESSLELVCDVNPDRITMEEEQGSFQFTLGKMIVEAEYLALDDRLGNAFVTGLLPQNEKGHESMVQALTVTYGELSDYYLPCSVPETYCYNSYEELNEAYNHYEETVPLEWDTRCETLEELKDVQANVSTDRDRKEWRHDFYLAMDQKLDRVVYQDDNYAISIKEITRNNGSNNELVYTFNYQRYFNTGDTRAMAGPIIGDREKDDFVVYYYVNRDTGEISRIRIPVPGSNLNSMAFYMVAIDRI